MKKKLPIYLNEEYFNECWSIEYFCIIDTNIKLRDWKFYNYNFITTNEGNDIVFGLNGKIYDQHSIYREVLDTTELQYYQLKENKLINFIKQKIIKNTYVFILLMNQNCTEFHEFLFYSFDDDKKIVSYPTFQNNKIITKEISYDYLVELYSNTLNYINQIYNLYLYKLNFFAPITTLKIKHNVRIPKININSFYQFLKRTYQNCWISAKVYFEDNLKYEYFNGLLGVINIILLEMDEYRYKNKRNYNFSKNLKSYILYRKFFFDCVKRFKIKLNLTIPNYQYLDFGFKTLENVLLILLKNKEYSNDLITNMREKIISVFKNDFLYIENLYFFIEKKLTNSF